MKGRTVPSNNIVSIMSYQMEKLIVSIYMNRGSEIKNTQEREGCLHPQFSNPLAFIPIFFIFLFLSRSVIYHQFICEKKC